MTTKVKVKKPEFPPIADAAEAEAVIADLALVMINERKLAAKRDAELAAIQLKYADDFARIAEAKAERTQRLMAWADANPSQFEKSKSWVVPAGRVFYRTGMPQLKPLPKWNWDKVLAELQRTGNDRFIRTTQEVAKDLILDAREALGPGVLAQMGVRVVQDETFNVEPDLSDVEKRITTPAN